MEIANKLVTIGALGFGVWAYFFSVKPVFDKEDKLQRQTRRAESLQERVGLLEDERSKLQQRLLRVQSFIGTNRKGIVLSHLAEIRRAIEKDARAYQGMAPVGFDLRNYSLAWAQAQLKRLGHPQPGSAAAYEREAFEFPPGTDDVRWLAPLLDAYDRESVSAGGGTP
jgi:hypothetical protein